MRIHEYASLLLLYRSRMLSAENYRRFQEYQAKQLVGYFNSFDISLKDRVVLDLGSGVGGYSTEFARHGAMMIRLDLVARCESTGWQIGAIQADASAIPMRASSADVIFCASLIEHVPDPGAVLCEMERVVRPGGSCYVSFPPYYSPLGGHEFAPFHYLGPSLAMRLKGPRTAVPGWTRDLYGLEPGSRTFSAFYRTWGLYKMTIRRFRCELGKTNLRCLNASTRYMPYSFIRWPLLGEFLTWHAQFLLVKPL